MPLDLLDLKLIELMLAEPRAGTREYARRLGVARGTIQSRLGRLERSGVIVSYAPQIAPGPLGFAVHAFVHVYVSLAKLDTAAAAVKQLPEVLEAYSVTGEADMICRVVAADNLALEHVVQRMLALPGVVRTRTELALNERVAHRIAPLVAEAQRRRPT